MYKGSNAEKLNNMSLYDLLCRIQGNAEERAKKQTVFCVLSLIENANPLFRCCGYFHNGKEDCQKCIADWLNEPYNGMW